MTTTVADVEDLILETVEALHLFRTVDSAGRKALPTAYARPAAFVYAAKEENTGVRSRLVMKETYEVIVAAKHMGSEEKAARTVYDLCDAVRDALHGTNWGVEDLDQFNYEGKEIVEYEAGNVSYVMTFSVVHKYGIV